MNPEDIAKQFVQAYYTTLASNKENLLSFYAECSSMTYGGQKFNGLKDIKEKIESFGFQKIVFSLDDLDCQLGPAPNSLFIFVTGTLNMDDSDTFKFSQAFNVLPNGSGGFYCHNDIFRTVI